MQISVLGPLQLVEQGVPVKVPGEKLRAIVASLSLTPGTPVLAGDLLDELWGERPPRTAENSLQSHIARLRRVLAEQTGKPATRDLVRTTHSGYLLAVAPEDVDAFRFTQAVERAGSCLAGDPERSIETLTGAFAEWRGPALLDAGGGMICRMAYVRLEETRLIARELLVEARLKLGQHQRTVPELEQLLTRHPLRERFCEQLMTALYRSGRQADAINTYHRVRRHLSAELGIEPGPGMRNTLKEVLLQKETLLR
ncbi:BTAD domain-containing putative transcriptional regulator [Streptomyces sp. NPDC048172]|uniref:AfsR/SARP family transcriptional regulator n=1 Tax=Streptomyces sp. NPDC048172 TaxID=3365505 RepID=UPI0037238C0F